MVCDRCRGHCERRVCGGEIYRSSGDHIRVVRWIDRINCHVSWVEARVLDRQRHLIGVGINNVAEAVDSIVSHFDGVLSLCNT